MSIIQDALKKAEINKKDGDEFAKSTVGRDRIPAKARPRRAVILATAGLVLLSVFAMAYFNMAGKSARNDDSRGVITPNKVETPVADTVSVGADMPAAESSPISNAPAVSGQDTGRFTHEPVHEPLTSFGFGTVQGSAPPQRSFTLNGIMYLEDGPQAIINGAVVNEGDIVSGAAVVKINRNNVVMKYNDAEMVLRLT